MNTDWIHDALTLLGIVIAALAGCTGWLMRHSSRITRVEARQDAAERAAGEDRHFIRSSLARIEDKIDRKADKP